ncbi:hypothetical protein Fot_03358 [Forsythia ovata]|uniref:Uncharacterized protein n=1 Tax=Forsythia ovata TaxID=205694 RepID=A0ABD1X9M4_9LAMI
MANFKMMLDNQYHKSDFTMIDYRGEARRGSILLSSPLFCQCLYVGAILSDVSKESMISTIWASECFLRFARTCLSGIRSLIMGMQASVQVSDGFRDLYCITGSGSRDADGSPVDAQFDVACYRRMTWYSLMPHDYSVAGYDCP